MDFAGTKRIMNEKQIKMILLILVLTFLSGFVTGIILTATNIGDNNKEVWSRGWDSGYSTGFIRGYQESIIWYPIYSKDIYIKHYNNSVYNWANGTTAEESFNGLEKKYYERRK